MADNFFCLELGDDYIRVADAKVNNQSIEFHSLGAITTPLSFFVNANEKSIDEAAQSIDKLINSLKIAKKSVNIIIPDTYSYSQILSMPYLKEKELLSAIKYQADQFIPLPLDQATIDLDIIFEDKKNKSLLILIVVAAQKLIDTVGDIVEKVGLIPQTIENEISATGKLISTVYSNQSTNQSFFFINFGYYSSSLYFYNSQRNLIDNIYNFKIGLDLFSREVQVNYNLDRQKANEALKTIGLSQGGSLNLEEILKPAFNEFVGEIEKFILSIKEKENIPAINQLLTFNLANQINFFEKKLEAQLGITTKKVDLLPLVKKNSNFEVFKQLQSSFITVIGGNIQ